MIRYVGLPINPRSSKALKTWLYKADRRTKVRQVLWGDWLNVVLEEGDGWSRVLWSPNRDPETLFIPTAHTTLQRPLEIIFVDVGQGDGAILISPEAGGDEKIIVIDAGERWNMKAFLRRRFSYRGYHFHAAVITHPDKDHYFGFRDIFADPNFGFDTIYHSGLVERPVSGDYSKLKGKKRDPSTGMSYVSDLAIDSDDINQIFADGPAIKRYDFPKVMNAAVNNPSVNEFQILSTAHGTIEGERSYLPGFAPSDDHEYSIEVLGPVMEFDGAGKPRLRVFKYVKAETGRLNTAGYSEVKNGHSVLLRLRYGKCRVLFGGDLNLAAEQFILTHYSDQNSWPHENPDRTKALIEQARTRLESEVFKVCHHGSADVTSEFLRAVNAEAFVLSSGDEKGHIHPRPDLLGLLGKTGRSERPVILSTELQRATREAEDEEIATGLAIDINRMMSEPSETLRDDLIARVMDLGGSNVTRYGAIYLKTDGDNLITAFRTELDDPTDKWFFYQFHLADDGSLNNV